MEPQFTPKLSFNHSAHELTVILESGTFTYQMPVNFYPKLVENLVLLIKDIIFSMRGGYDAEAWQRQAELHDWLKGKITCKNHCMYLVTAKLDSSSQIVDIIPLVEWNPILQKITILMPRFAQKQTPPLLLPGYLNPFVLEWLQALGERLEKISRMKNSHLRNKENLPQL